MRVTLSLVEFLGPLSFRACILTAGRVGRGACLFTIDSRARSSGLCRQKAPGGRWNHGTAGSRCTDVGHDETRIVRSSVPMFLTAAPVWAHFTDVAHNMQLTFRATASLQTPPFRGLLGATYGVLSLIQALENTMVYVAHPWLVKAEGCEVEWGPNPRYQNARLVPRER